VPGYITSGNVTEEAHVDVWLDWRALVDCSLAGSSARIQWYISACARTPAILSSAGHVQGYIATNIITGQAPTLA